MFTEIKDYLFPLMPSNYTLRSKVTDKTRGDKYIWGIILLLAIISLLVVYSATGSLAYKYNKGNNEIYLFKQLCFIIIGLLIVYFLHNIKYNIYLNVSSILFYLSIPLLIYTLFFGVEVNDASRWIKLPVINLTIQTSDLARLALFMYLSKKLSRKQEDIKSFKKGFLPVALPVAIVCALIMPANLSTALLTGLTSLLLMFIGRVNLKHILAIMAIAIVPVLLIISIAKATYNPDKTDTHKDDITSVIKSTGRLGTWIQRVQDYMYADDSKIPYQVQQQNIAIANGNIFFGLGPGNSKQKNYLPQAYNDSIYPVIIEEYGLLGGAFIIFMYIIFLFRCIRIFRRCPYAFGAFLALALSFTLVIQAMANMAVGVNLIPVTGVTLPLVSMGGSSFLFTCASIGIILSVAKYMENKEEDITRIKVIKTDDKQAIQPVRANADYN